MLHDRPDGTNINDQCGSTHPSGLQRSVVERHADAGLAFDGDADRVLAVDAAGALVDGDQIIAVCALDLLERGQLVDDTVVITVMTNLGFRLAMRERGVRVIETQVGDRYVLDALDDGGWSLGGEQSGHVIFRQLASTGDGLLTGVQLLDVMVRAGRAAGRAGRRDAPTPAGAAQRAGDGLCDRADRADRRARSQRRPTSWANRAGCWCGRAGPSPWSG